MKKKDLLAMIQALDARVRALEEQNKNKPAKEVQTVLAKSIGLQKRANGLGLAVSHALEMQAAEAEKEVLLNTYSGEVGRLFLCNIPDDERTPGHVLAQRGHAAVGGCCERFANQSGCNCLAEALDRQRGK